MVVVAGESSSGGKVASSCHPEKSHGISVSTVRRYEGQDESLRRAQDSSTSGYLSKRIKSSL